MSAAVTIRLARLDERAALDALCFRSKAHWGYDSGFMARCRDILFVPAPLIEAELVWVAADAADRPLGLVALDAADGDPISLDMLFIEPDAIGRGIGDLLFRHAVSAARGLQATALDIHSDPFAAGFYERMGARRTGEAPSEVLPGRMLPVYRLDL